MKAIRIPLLVLAVLVGFLVWNAVWTSHRCQQWTAAVDAVSAAAAAGDMDTASRELAALDALWQQPRTYLHIIVAHAELDEAESLLAQAHALCRQGDSQQLYPLLAQLRTQFLLISETQQISLENIL